VIQRFPLAGRIAAWSIATALLLAPRVSEACAVCSSRDDGSQRGFLIGTLIMTLLPFLVIGSILLVVRAAAAPLPAAVQPFRDFGSARARGLRAAGRSIPIFQRKAGRPAPRPSACHPAGQLAHHHRMGLSGAADPRSSGSICFLAVLSCLATFSSPRGLPARFGRCR
jgi:hypothetical protein